jgi:signal transduction histidine kinase
VRIGAMLIGAEAALHDRRDSDQMALLMRYAANPIVLSDATSIIDLNAPAARLFDVTPAPDAEDQNEQITAVARNRDRLSAFLAEPFTGESHAGELHLEEPYSHEELVMAIASSHVPEALAGTPGTVSVLHDLTRARELADHRIREQLFESEKLAATGRLAASIAHEINNPLEAIKNALYLLVARADEHDPDFRFLALAQRETERVARIVRQMLGVARPSVAAAPIDVNEVLGEALQLLEPQLRQSRATLTVNLDTALPRVRASADQLKQVFLNLLLNAKDAMPNGGGLLVQTRIAHEGDSEFLAGRHIIIRIRDDGAGIAPDILPRVFEPFFSTKSERQGTGLGLWVCQDIIHHHGGQILVRSMVGRGTTFLVALPFISDHENEQGASNS